VCVVISAARSKKKKGAGDKKVAGQSAVPKTDSKKPDSDAVSEIPEYVDVANCFLAVSIMLSTL